jgi:endonuclease-8
VPEGDTIHRTAARLHATLAGRALVRLELSRVRGLARVPSPGTEITAVEAVGKHVLVRFADGTTLRSHMRMSGSWHVYPRGAVWRRPAHLARAVVEVDGWVAVCFAAPVVELERDDTALAHLGPDLTSPTVGEADVEAAVARFADCAKPDDEIGAVLLDQRIACGVGNAVKSETLFVCRLDPFTPLRDIDVPMRRRVIENAARLLRSGAKTGAHGSGLGGAPAVYGRAGQPCGRCGARVQRRRQGEQARSTYWCPACQVHPAAREGVR